MWRELLAWLAALSADPALLEKECPRACACVSVARASMEKEERKPRPKPGDEEKEEQQDLPVVPIQPNVRRSGRIVCENGTCYWVDEVTGERLRVVR